jgi:hypothetical protein
MNDTELLKAFRRGRSEEAFATGPTMKSPCSASRGIRKRSEKSSFNTDQSGKYTALEHGSEEPRSDSFSALLLAYVMLDTSFDVNDVSFWKARAVIL